MKCYNKGCGVEFSEEENGSEACTHHPGVPVFHDAYKGWSCCKKRTTDFTEFLNIPGCMKSPHNSEKPPEVEPKQVESNGEEKKEVVVVEAPRQPDPGERVERPSEDEEMITLKTTVGSSLKTALSKLDINTHTNQENNDTPESTITIGTSCKNTSCHTTYQGEQTDRESCTYHPGTAIFHEGMKYWSCCRIKTSDFDNFMAQQGCERGSHRWTETDQEKAQKVACRYDWHQTSGFAVLSVYCKHCLPARTTVKANQVCLSIDICFDNGKNRFQKEITLEGVIDPRKSSVQLLGTKAEIKLKKAEPLSWKKYEL